MIHFTNGPAQTVNLCLRRAPILLRVVQGADGMWDALDQLDDTPKPGETIYVYRQTKYSGRAFIDYRDGQGRRRGSSTECGAYELYAHQPDDAVMRDNERWAAWCETQRPIIFPPKEGAS